MLPCSTSFSDKLGSFHISGTFFTCSYLPIYELISTFNVGNDGCFHRFPYKREMRSIRMDLFVVKDTTSGEDSLVLRL